MSKKGFTLIELLVVIAVLGILAAVVLVAINPAQRLRSARDSGVRSDIGQMATALETYYTTNAQYPDGTTDLTPDELKNIPSPPSGRSIDCTNGTGTAGYQYTVATDNSEAALYCYLEAPASTAAPVYCYRTAVGAASEMAATDCTP